VKGFNTETASGFFDVLENVKGSSTDVHRIFTVDEPDFFIV
jgi:hypothetical protein